MRRELRSILWVVLLVSFWPPAVPSGLAAEAPFGPEIFRARRAALLDSLGEGTAVLYSRGTETEAGYRADADFWYLTGCDDEGAVLVLSPGERDRDLLLLAGRDPEEERWTGERPALTDSLREALGFDAVRRTGSLGRYLLARVKHDPVMYLISPPVSPDNDLPPDLDLYQKMTARYPGARIENGTRFLPSMRMVKSDAEIAAIEKAIAVTHAGMTELIAAARPGLAEFQLDGVLEASFKRQGAQFMAFEPIVGAGRQSTVLHYQRRDRNLEEGDLLLLDVGAEWDRYAADITRTVPVNGRFSEEQGRIYDLVLKAQDAGIAAVRPGVTIRDVHEAARDMIREAGYADAFMHGTSHYLGLDVHDTGDDDRPLEPGMVITVEPGIYLPDVEIGVRIEDDVLVTKKGHRVLSAAIPRTRSEVEAWVTTARVDAGQ